MCHRWWRRGERAPGTRQIGYQWAYIFSAVRPDTGDDVTLVMPSVNAKVMDLFLAHFADTLDQDAHAAMMCDGAGWHDERALTVPDNVTLALLPPYSPELNPVERVWLYLRERFLSLRVLDDTEAIIDACCQAWIDLIAEPDRMRTLWPGSDLPQPGGEVFFKILDGKLVLPLVAWSISCETPAPSIHGPPSSHQPKCGTLRISNAPGPFGANARHRGSPESVRSQQAERALVAALDGDFSTSRGVTV